MFSCLAIVGKSNEPLFLKSFHRAQDGAGAASTAAAAAAAAAGAAGSGSGASAAVPGSDSDLKYHYIVHTALDVVEEKVTTITKVASELYLGLLYPAEEYKVYGYVTNTRVKLIAVWEEGNPALREMDVRSFFRRLHDIYADMLCNPFYTPGDKITAVSFDKQVAALNQAT
ncbi:hypothetical protein CAOG_05799 [Capsaspora owczarzaki ATCC 30864]|nr:hypothetical protein CAOG_05799 [Capsaspora owczarzaki ATCC 30864]|eukprot:XP_004345389.1 hypothetical protein CAOG_05799 [Capsaspora owczarzaki ATCC 30864]